MTYGKRTLIAVDQLLNTLLGGWPDETLSSRCYRWARDGGEGMAPARGGRAVLLAEGTLQKQLREREGRQAVAAGVKREKGYSINNKQGLPYSIPYSILLPQKRERSCHYLCQRKRKSFAVHTVNVIRR